MSTLESVDTFKCEYCSREFASRGGRTRHIQLTHKIGRPSVYVKQRRAYKKWYRKEMSSKDGRTAKAEAARSFWLRRAEQLRAQLFEIYGARCNCCGETIARFLTLDHVHNDGKVERKAMSHPHSLWKKAIAEKDPTKYQILCFNCNLGKAKNHGVCPHKELKPESDYKPTEKPASAPSYG